MGWGIHKCGRFSSCESSSYPLHGWCGYTEAVADPPSAMLRLVSPRNFAWHWGQGELRANASEGRLSTSRSAPGTLGTFASAATSTPGRRFCVSLPFTDPANLLCFLLIRNQHPASQIQLLPCHEFYHGLPDAHHPLSNVFEWIMELTASSMSAELSIMAEYCSVRRRWLVCRTNTLLSPSPVRRWRYQVCLLMTWFVISGNRCADPFRRSADRGFNTIFDASTVHFSWGAGLSRCRSSS